MFKTLGNLTKAAVSVAVTPVAAAVDLVDVSDKPDDGMFPRANKLLENAGECVEEALKPDREE